jgi:hypothetical protein
MSRRHLIRDGQWITCATCLDPASDTLTQKSTLVELLATYESASERSGN